MKAKVTFECTNWSKEDNLGYEAKITTRTINFTTVNGAKRALINCIRKNYDWLVFAYGHRAKFNIIARIEGHEYKEGEYFMQTDYSL